MARCASPDGCERWRPGVIAKRGLHVDGLWLCSVACVERMAHRRLVEAAPLSAGLPRLPPVRLGTLLRHQEAITAAQLERALAEQRQTGLKLGAQVVALGFADDDAVLRALAAQAGVSYLANVDSSCVRDTEMRLAPDTVRALGLVPFGPIVGGRIKVVCSAPVPRAAVNALRHLTGLTADVYLVADAVWTALAEAYAGALQRPDVSQPVPQAEYASSLSDVASRVAAAAISGRRIVVTQARWDPYTWVRVQSTGLIRDVLFARGDHLAHPEEATPCLADSTSH
jgi:hypothetical protein